MKIAVVGSYGVGMTMRFTQFPRPGETLMGGIFDAGPGGKGSNQAIGAARLGAEVSFLTAIGPDDFGLSARALWKAEGVDDSCVVTGKRHTMVGCILVDADGENRIIVAAGALDELTPTHVENFRSHISKADVLIVSMELALPAVLAALKVGREEGVKIILNPAPAVKLPPEAWSLFDVITPNRTEVPVLLGLSHTHGLSPEELVAQLRLKTNAKIVMTLGSQGCLVDDGINMISVPSFKVKKVIDTTGAGDSFTSALAVALAEGREFHQSVKFAAASGAHSVAIAGVIDSLPKREEIDKWLAQ
ncbi:ribokinase [Actinomycetes bacterium]|nr:ribokinase [Actinomycetes bacterium]